MMKKILFLLVTASLFLSCAKKPANYFPLKIGDKWEYNFSMNNNGTNTNTTMTYTIKDTATIDDKKYFKFESVFGPSSGMGSSTDLYRLSDSGIVIGSNDPISKSELVIIPADISIGKQWEAVVSAADKRTYKVSAFEDVSAGDKTYKDCIKIDYAETNPQEKDSGYFYFAKNVGLIKFFLKGERYDNTSSTTDATLSSFTE